MLLVRESSPCRIFKLSTYVIVVCLSLTVLLSRGVGQSKVDEKTSTANVSASQTPTFSTEVKVVNLLASVRDRHGQIISDLAKDDFSLQEDGRPQTIKYFGRETNLPLKLGLLVDTSMSVSRVLPDERKASQSFLDQVLREGTDSAFVIHFDRQVELLQDATSSRQKLESAMDQIDASPRDDNGSGGTPGGGRGGGPGGGHHRGGGGTLLYDAVFLSSDELMQKQQGRKALILLTDGDDRGSKTSLEHAIESTQRANTIVYCIYFKGEQGAGFNQPTFGRGGGSGRGGMGRGGSPRTPYPQESHEDGKKVLERMARETGGRFFEVSKKQPIDQIYVQIQQELRNQYSIGYTPDRSGSAASYHKIQLTAKAKDRVVQTRDGYYD
jgi:VWFA-related protein